MLVLAVASLILIMVALLLFSIAVDTVRFYRWFCEWFHRLYVTLAVASWIGGGVHHVF